ncbi:hypothetical protein ANCCEY_09048 [Ancylostoma ceylanicum]|uniref:Uncharacterized protein n=1 Tax=Ancylostoma ceylanicum TaxID=53326 RepID=A0A0D6LW52_9BILA|nr:hypothetical protein ANCCEY_09048 [Ancylostoma ceylanicum]
MSIIQKVITCRKPLTPGKPYNATENVQKFFGAGDNLSLKNALRNWLLEDSGTKAGAEVEEEVAAEAALQPEEEEPARAEKEGNPSRDREEHREGEDVPDVVANPQVWDDHVAPDRAVHVDHDPDIQDRVVQEDREAAVVVAAGRDDRGLGRARQGEVEGRQEEEDAPDDSESRS